MGHWSQGWIQDFAERGSPGATLALDNPLSAKHTILGGGGGRGGHTPSENILKFGCSEIECNAAK